MTDILDKIAELVNAGLTAPKEPVFPWYGEATWDHLNVQAIITSRVYRTLGLEPPSRFVSAPSPAAMYTAINMLRTIQSGQKHKFIESLVPVDDPIAAAKKTVMDAIIDPKITSTVGQLLKPLLRWKSRHVLWATDLQRYLAQNDLVSQSAQRSEQERNPFYKAISVDEITIYPVNFTEVLSIQNQTLSFVPYVHICWICQPPIQYRAYDDGHLEFMRFADGYEISLPPVPALPEDVMELPALPPAHKCVDCGEPGTHTRFYRDVCPTDRGSEVREGEEWVCNECDPLTGLRSLP